MKIAGIDYSMTSPAICVFDTECPEFTFENCKLNYLTQLKKYDVQVKNIIGEYFEYENDMERYDLISSKFIDIVLLNDVERVFIEDYSMGSRGKVFNIAENTGILKYRLWQFQIPVEGIAPTVIKKFATGKGNSDKQKMQDAFELECNLKLKHEFNMTEKQWNPSSDIIDSYYICKYGYTNMEKL
jgi:Holliday junction resolvasome RuvABC endonuclease subunit